MTIDSIRKVLGIPMFINNGKDLQNRCYRTLKSNVGAKAGAHYKGMAVDFDFVKVNAEEGIKLIYKNIIKFPYIRCIETDVNWIHVDVMGEDDSDKRKGVNEKTILLYSPVTGSKVVNRNEL